METVTKNTTHFIFPQELLKNIDKLVGKRKRSRFVIEATQEKLAKERFLKVVKDSAGAWSDKNYPELKTKNDLGEYIRNLRRPWQKRAKRLYG